MLLSLNQSTQSVILFQGKIGFTVKGNSIPVSSGLFETYPITIANRRPQSCIQRFYTNSFGSFKYRALTAKPETAYMSPPSLSVVTVGKDLAKVSISNGGAKTEKQTDFLQKYKFLIRGAKNREPDIFLFWHFVFHFRLCILIDQSVTINYERRVSKIWKDVKKLLVDLAQFE